MTQTTPSRLGRRELAACMNALTERVLLDISPRDAWQACNAYLETLRYVQRARIDTKMLRSLPAAYGYLELRRTLRHTSTPDASCTTRLARSRSPINTLDSRRSLWFSQQCYLHFTPRVLHFTAIHCSYGHRSGQWYVYTIIYT